MAVYKFKAQFTPYSEGYYNETTGCIGGDTEWTTDVMSGTRTAEYYYRDTNRGDLPPEQYDKNASEVHVIVKDSWTAERLSDNRIKITLDTDIVDIWRFLPAGNGSPINPAIPYWRNVVVYNDLADARAKRNPIASYMNWEIDDYSHKPPVLNIPTRVIYLDPGDESRITNSLFFHSWSASATQDFWKDPAIQDGFNDSMGMGVAFVNLLPKDFGHGIIYHWQDSKSQTDTDEWRDTEECSTRSVISKVIDRPHWIFEGWATSPNGSVRYHAGDRLTVCDQEVHLYAIWRYTYRPGMHRIAGVWKSCDRDGATGPVGRCNIRRNNMWIEMRIDPNNSGLSDPPCIMQNSWRIMKLIGDEGSPHDINWSCPHQWP